MDDLLAVKVWDADDGEEPEERNVNEGVIAPDAAESYAERQWADNDYPDETTVCVRCSDGSLHCYVVEAERTVSFCAVEHPDALQLPLVRP